MRYTAWKGNEADQSHFFYKLLRKELPLYLSHIFEVSEIRSTLCQYECFGCSL